MFIRIDVCTTDSAKIATNISNRLPAVLCKKGLLGQFLNVFFVYILRKIAFFVKIW